MLSQQEIKETFAFFDDWEDRYRYIIDLGKGLSDMPDELRVEENLVRGCQSLVWIIFAYDEKTQKVAIQLDSDAFIVRGLIAILLSVFQGRSPAEICVVDVNSLFHELDLLTHLSSTRGNGLKSMVGRIQDEARFILEATPVS